MLNILTYAGPYPVQGLLSGSTLDETSLTPNAELVSTRNVRLLAATAPSSSLSLAAEQTTNFTAAAGNEYPVNVSGNGATSDLTVSPPPAPAIGDTFRIFDSRSACTATRRIKADFAGSKLLGVANEVAYINSVGGLIEFKYVSAAVGWRLIISN